MSLKYVQINAYSGGWAENIIFRKHYQLQSQGVESYVIWARGSHQEDEYMIKIGSFAEVCFDAFQTRIDGKASFHSRHNTRRLLNKLDEINPDIVHLHVLLGYYLNLPMLFDWLSRQNCKILWTLHDAWVLTGHCIHFDYIGCEQWKNGCAQHEQCPQKREYPETFLGGDSSVRWCYSAKKSLITSIPKERLSFISPSKWLAKLVQQSYLGAYSIKVIPNTVNPEIFRPTPSTFREDYSVGNRVMILGVASKWSEKKGLNSFIELYNSLDPKQFVIVLVGLTKKQIKRLPSDLIALEKTRTIEELVEIYSAADIFFNPTLEDNYPTVNLEAEACGTPVYTFNTGGCCETIKRSDSCLVENLASFINRLQCIAEAKQR